MRPYLSIILIVLSLSSHYTCQKNSLDPRNPNLQTIFLDLFNQARITANVAPLTWNQTLVANAQIFANSLAANDLFIPNSDLAENIWRGPTGSLSIAEIIDIWVKIASGPPSPENNSDVSNYSHIIWDATTGVGCGSATSLGNDYYVCRYSLKAQPPPQQRSSRLPDQYIPAQEERIKVLIYNEDHLTWDSTLAAKAQNHSEYLAANNIFEHSGDLDVGENLWSGPEGVYEVDEMVGVWLYEKRYFANRPFPNVSITGNWADVANYTQLIWKGTYRVGCGLATEGSRDYFVCQFFPRGNIEGRTPIGSHPLDGDKGYLARDRLVIPAKQTGDIRVDSLEAHNQIRSMYTFNNYTHTYTLTNLTWNETLAKSAQDFAKYLADNNIFEHSGDIYVGENIWSGPVGISFYEMIQAWLDETQFFFGRLSPKESVDGRWKVIANFSQLYWEGTRMVGCGIANNTNKAFYVCHYDVPWNRGAQCKFKPIDIKQDSLDAHNQVRMEYGVGNLTWDEALADSAQTFAKYLAENSIFAHTGNISIGENVWISQPGTYSICLIVQEWLANFTTRTFQFDSSNYSQLVWPGAAKVGCGLANGNLSDYFVCHYDVPWDRDAQYRFKVWDLTTYMWVQNKERSGSPPLTWNDTLWKSAQEHATYLAHNNIFEHTNMKSVGENLWSGPVGVFSIPEITQVWIDEKKYFMNGIFPNVSKTGNWADVSNYTQIIWSETNSFACGFATNELNDYYVCHYHIPGNYNGIRPRVAYGRFSDGRDDEVSALHDLARKKYLLDLLSFDVDLAVSVQRFTQYMANNSVSEYDQKPNIGKNTYIGPAGFLTPGEIVQLWLDEEQFYVNGVFPSVSSTGDWRQVENYTQIIWSDTELMACGITRSLPYDYFACFYSPAGNIMGQNPIDGMNTLPEVSKPWTNEDPKNEDL